jgi:hypothetical protein
VQKEVAPVDDGRRRIGFCIERAPDEPRYPVSHVKLLVEEARRVGVTTGVALELLDGRDDGRPELGVRATAAAIAADPLT